jgi:hypothetical protein
MYRVDETGVLNNYATEPQIYFAEYPFPEQQLRYALQGAIAFLFVTACLFVAIGVS